MRDEKTFTQFYHEVFMPKHSNPMTKLFHFVGWLMIVVPMWLYIYQTLDPAQTADWKPVVIGTLVGLPLTFISHKLFKDGNPNPLIEIYNDGIVNNTLAYFRMCIEILYGQHRIVPHCGSKDTAAEE